MTTAPTLFETLPPRRAATLEETRLRDQQILVLEALVDMQRRDPRGANPSEVQTWLMAHDIDRGIQRNAISSRCAELDEWYGFVVQVGERHAVTGKAQHVYAPTADGVAWVQQRRAVA